MHLAFTRPFDSGGTLKLVQAQGHAAESFILARPSPRQSGGRPVVRCRADYACRWRAVKLFGSQSSRRTNSMLTRRTFLQAAQTSAIGTSLAATERAPARTKIAVA